MWMLIWEILVLYTLGDWRQLQTQAGSISGCPALLENITFRNYNF